MRTKTIFLYTMICFILVNYFTIFAQGEEVREVLESIGNELNQALIAGDYETILSHFTDDIIVFPVFDPPIKGKSAYREAVKKVKEQGIQYKSMSGSSTEMWECGNMVYDIGTFGLSLVTKDSPKPKAYYGSYFNVWQKQSDGSYKLKYMMSNLDFNPYKK
jgi:ketosteroid isomerase-like protein